jgi:glutathione peroxidase
MADLDYDTPVETLDGRATTLAPHAGKVLLIVNTASRCGFTPQYAGLEALHRRFKDRGLAVLGFPCDQFGHQEPGTGAEIASFCEQNYGVTFPMHSKIEVNGAGAHPLFVHLKKAAPGVLGTQAIKWNFTKFLVNRAGAVVERYAPNTPPEEIAPDIERLLEERRVE